MHRIALGQSPDLTNVKANKRQIKQAGKKLYDIDVAKVNTLIRPDGEMKEYRHQIRVSSTATMGPFMSVEAFFSGGSVTAGLDCTNVNQQWAQELQRGRLALEAEKRSTEERISVLMFTNCLLQLSHLRVE
ncbi:hypothetical protein GH733_017747 [Mirounga leonina]|nr:hypothetical protein GH733_017747 [Mirounga leonina]